MSKYGLISETDAKTIEKTIDLILKEFPHDETINYTEIGLFNCATAKGVRDYVLEKRRIFITGVDNQKDKPTENTNWLDIFIIGNSDEVAFKIKDNSQNIIFLDGCHCFAHVISDFFCYAPKVRKGGYLAFHDSGVHIKPLKDFQHGDPENPCAYISVRNALHKIGLIDDDHLSETTIQFYKQELDNWELVFDEADKNNEAGGVSVFKRLK